MCTTYLALELIKYFKDYDLIGFPKLVRLNPNIPWKTRGNAAICLRFGKGYGEKYLIGKIKNKEYFGYENGKSINIEDAKNRIMEIIESNAHFDCENTNPAFVISTNKFSREVYWKAVREIVNLKDIKIFLRNNNSLFKGYKNERGLIGATAAIAWESKKKTYEIIAYREREKWGTKREVDKDSIINMDKNFQDTFNNYDYLNNYPVITPNSQCPVLFGIRSTKPDCLQNALNSIKSEKVDRWLIFETNQATDNHLQKKDISNINPYESVIVRGKVISNPKTIKGGHVIFKISNGNFDIIDCAAYEPTKQFRNIIRELKIGDVVTIFGGVHEKPFTINIEKIKIEKLVNFYKKLENPLCECGKRMKSIGKNKGYRCKACGNKIDEESVEKKLIKRNINEMFYEVPPSARRHLSKPLKLMEINNKSIAKNPR